MKKNVNAYLEENICFGRDRKGKNKMLFAFQPLKILSVSAGAIMVIVKPKGRGNYREYLIRTELLKFKED
jgi:hypothetical protein